MMNRLPLIFWFEAALTLLNAALLLLTIVETDWIEAVFKIDPDAGSGAAEWGVMGITLLLTIVFFALARSEWQRAMAPTQDSARP
jgi:hypothetical protein